MITQDNLVSEFLFKSRGNLWIKSLSRGVFNEIEYAKKPCFFRISAFRGYDSTTSSTYQKQPR